MGLSLKSIGKRVEGLGAQINPFDNGATYNTVLNNQHIAPAPSIGQQLSTAGRGIVSGTINPISRVGNEFGALAALASRNQQAAQHFLQPGGGLGHQGGVLQGRELSPGAVFIGPHAFQNIGATVGTGASIGSNLVAPGAGLAARGPVALKIAKGALSGAAIGATGGAGQQLGTTGKVSLRPTLESAAAGAILGAAPPIIKAVNAVPKNEIGAVGKNVNKPNVPEVPQGQTVYRAGKPLAQENVTDRGISVTPSKKIAQNKFSAFWGKGPVNTHTLSPDAKIMPHSEIPKDLYKQSSSGEINPAGAGNGDYQKIIAYAKSKGYDGVDLKRFGEGEIRVFDPKHLDATPTTQPAQGAKLPISKLPARKGPSPALPRVSANKSLTPVEGVNKAAGQGTLAPPPDFLKPSKNYVPKTPEELASLSPKEQMTLADLQGKGPNKLAPPEVNTARNPYQSPLTKVEPGNYKGAIQNSQLVSHPIETAGSLWQRSMKSLSPEERTNFWKAVEKPNGNYSPQLKNSINLWRQADNMVHGHSQALGGNTNYLTDHGLHPWQLPEEYTQHIINGGSASKFTGLNNISRKYRTIEEGQANGLTLGTDPTSEGARYLQANAAILRKQALKQGLAEADSQEMAKGHTLPLGGDHTVALSKKGIQATKSLQQFMPTDNKAIVGLRTTNQGTKSLILSAGQFHTNNIGLVRAAPTIATPKLQALLKGDLTAGSHPIRATKLIYRQYRAAFGNKFADRVIGKSFTDKVVDPGTGQELSVIDAAAQIGMPYGGSGYDVSGTLLKSGIGSKTVFGKQIPMGHDQVVRSILDDLQKQKVPFNSAEAREAGLAGANMMGELNRELQNISPRMQRTMTDTMLAGQFTPSKFIQMKRAATKGGVGGSYARANVAANVAATTAVIAGVGYLAGQKSDNIKDLLLRALIDPAAPTNQKDSKGNTVKLRTPGTDTSDIAKLLGIKLVRNSDGHLGVSWHGLNASTAEDFAKARFSPILSAGVKVLTNENFSNKPLYDPNAPGGTKAIQGATSVLTGDLPIGLQGLPQTNAIKSHLPGSVQEVLNAQKPGGNPLVKSIGSSFGLSPATDQTVGKGQQSAQYFDAVSQNAKGLDRQSKDAYDLWTGSKKNPVTGKYDVQPNANDARAKATALLQNSKALSAIINLNHKQASEGQSSDPLWGLSKDQVTKYLQYQSMAPGSADKTDWYNKNQSWYAPLVDQRNQFFDSLPPGDPNKPKLNIQYPTATPQVSSLETAYSNLTDSTAKGQFINQHPELIEQWNKQANYTNQMRQALGYSPVKGYPEASTQLQSFMSTYSNASKAQRAAIRNSSPQQYQNMIGYFDSVDLYNIGKQASVSQFQGEPDYTSKEAKSISSLAKDIYKNPDGTYSIAPAGWMQGLSNSSGGFNSSNSKYHVSSRSLRGQNPAIAYDKIRGKRVSLRGKGTGKGKVVAKGGAGRPTVSIKKSLV